MNFKRFITGGLVLFIVFQVSDFIIHNLYLSRTYMAMSGVWRPDMISKMWIMYISSFIFSFLVMYVFIKGYEGRGIPEGIRFGILIGLMTNGVGAFYQYALYPLPFTLVIQWFILGLIEFTLAGIAAAAIYRPLAGYEEE